MFDTTVVIITKLTGIKKDKTRFNTLMYIPIADTQNDSFCRLQLVVETNQLKFHKKSQKLLRQQIGQGCYKTFGTSVIKSPMSPPSC